MKQNSRRTVIQTYRTSIMAAPQAICEALTMPAWSVQYGYALLVDYELWPGGRFWASPNEGMKACPNIPDVIPDGQVLEVSAARKLVQTCRMLMDPGLAAEGFTHLTVELLPVRGGVTRQTVTHDLSGAPTLAAHVSGEREAQGAGGGWNEILSGLKTPLETGAPLALQSGPEQKRDRVA